MKTLITAAALTLALAVPAFAQDSKPVIPPAATPAQSAPAAPDVVAPKAATPAPVAPKAAAPAPAAPKAATAPAPAATKTAAPAVVAPKTAAPATPAVTKAAAPAAAAPAAAAPKTVAPAAPVVTKAAAPAAAKAAVKLVNLNTATAAELDALPKIGKARTKAIIAGRPYASVDDLIAKKVLPKDAFEAIKAKVSVK